MTLGIWKVYKFTPSYTHIFILNNVLVLFKRVIDYLFITTLINCTEDIDVHTKVYVYRYPTTYRSYEVRSELTEASVGNAFSTHDHTSDKSMIFLEQ